MKTKGKNWTKGYDYIDNSPRYTFEDRDPCNTLETIRVVIYQEMEKEYSHDTQKRPFYYGMVENSDKETQDVIGRFRLLKDAKRETEKLFAEYCKLYPEAI
jgi:hypothetical protein